MENDAIVDELGIFDRASDLLHDPDIAQVDVGGGGRDEASDGFDGDGREGGRVLRDDLFNVNDYIY